MNQQKIHFELGGTKREERTITRSDKTINEAVTNWKLGFVIEFREEWIPFETINTKTASTMLTRGN